MPQYDKPTEYVDWTSGQPTQVSAPTPALQTSGFTSGQRPAYQNLNWLFWRIGGWIRYFAGGLNAVMTGASQEPGYRLVGGGLWSFSALTGVLAWSEPFYIAMPGLADTANTVAAGSATIAAGQVAYVASNAPFSTTGNTTTGSNLLTELAFESGIGVGEVVTGPGIPANTTVTAISASNSSVTMSNAATATASGVNVVFAPSGPLTVQCVDGASLAANPNTVIVALSRLGTDGNAFAMVGVNAGQMRLLDGEAKALLGNGYVSTMRLTAGVDLPARTAVYISPGTVDGGNTRGFVYPVDASAETGSTIRAKFVGVVPTATAAGKIAEVVTVGRVGGYAGLGVGSTHYASPTTAGRLQTVPDNSTGRFVIPIGVGLSDTVMFVSATAAAAVLANGSTIPFYGPITAPSVTSAVGFRSMISMGKLITLQANNTQTYALYEAAIEVTGSQTVNTVVRKTMGSAGTMTALVANSRIGNYGSAMPTNFTVTKNGVTIYNSITNTTPMPSTGVLRLNQRFVAGDEIQVLVKPGDTQGYNVDVSLQVAFDA